MLVCGMVMVMVVVMIVVVVMIMVMVMERDYGSWRARELRRGLRECSHGAILADNELVYLL